MRSFYRESVGILGLHAGPRAFLVLCRCRMDRIVAPHLRSSRRPSSAALRRRPTRVGCCPRGDRTALTAARLRTVARTPTGGGGGGDCDSADVLQTSGAGAPPDSAALERPVASFDIFAATRIAHVSSSTRSFSPTLEASFLYSTRIGWPYRRRPILPSGGRGC